MCMHMCMSTCTCTCTCMLYMYMCMCMCMCMSRACPYHSLPLCPSTQAAAAREAEQLRAMLAAAERAAERETRRGRSEVDSRRQRSAPGDVQPSLPANERARAARLLGRVTTAERLVASPEERDLDAISIPLPQRSLSPQSALGRLAIRGATPHSADRSPHSPPPQELVALSPASRTPPHATSSPTAITRCPGGVPPPSSHLQVLARAPDAAAAYAAFAAAAGGGGSLLVTPGGGPKRPLQRQTSLAGHPADLVRGTPLYL